jgi:hypothetical protein
MHTNDSDLAVLYALRVRATVLPVCGWRAADAPEL